LLPLQGHPPELLARERELRLDARDLRFAELPASDCLDERARLADARVELPARDCLADERVRETGRLSYAPRAVASSARKREETQQALLATGSTWAQPPERERMDTSSPRDSLDSTVAVARGAARQLSVEPVT
jgi:hypothetical protein